MGIYACHRCGHPHGWSSVTMSEMEHDCPQTPSVIDRVEYAAVLCERRAQEHRAKGTGAGHTLPECFNNLENLARAEEAEACATLIRKVLK